MPYAVRPTLDAILSFIKADGLFPNAQIGEFKTPPQGDAEGLAAAIWMVKAGVAELTLATTIEQHVVNVRVYRNAMAEPTADTEEKLADAHDRIMVDLLGDSDLGGSIRAIDSGGIYGAKLEATWGYVDVGGTMFRVFDLAIPMIIDDSATVAA